MTHGADNESTQGCDPASCAAAHQSSSCPGHDPVAFPIAKVVSTRLGPGVPSNSIASVFAAPRRGTGS